uniref:Bm1443 n=1 Tax=Brugia malayi TaxID=6279 RepID=A0A1I9G3V4_BRUMA|nr:Bm1443 [Brugia malayi]
MCSGTSLLISEINELMNAVDVVFRVFKVFQVHGALKMFRFLKDGDGDNMMLSVIMVRLKTTIMPIAFLKEVLSVAPVYTVYYTALNTIFTCYY